MESITDKAAPFAVYDETFSDSYRVEEHEFGGYAAKSYHRSWEEPDAALPMMMHEVIYCIDTGDEMIRLTLTPFIVPPWRETVAFLPLSGGTDCW